MNAFTADDYFELALDLPEGEPAMQRSGVMRLRGDLLVCGDHLATPSIQGAMLAGRRAAEALLTASAKS